MSRSTLRAVFVASSSVAAVPDCAVCERGGANPKPTTAGKTQTSGERLFAINCGRCHQPPMSISPRTTGTILMHMRTRARLSRADEQALLKFMAP